MDVAYFGRTDADVVGHWRVITIEGDDCACGGGRRCVKRSGEPGERSVERWAGLYAVRDAYIAHVEVAQEAAAIQIGFEADNRIERVGGPVHVFEQEILSMTCSIPPAISLPSVTAPCPLCMVHFESRYDARVHMRVAILPALIAIQSSPVSKVQSSTTFSWLQDQSHHSLGPWLLASTLRIRMSRQLTG